MSLKHSLWDELSVYCFPSNRKYIYLNVLSINPSIVIDIRTASTQYFTHIPNKYLRRHCVKTELLTYLCLWWPSPDGMGRRPIDVFHLCFVAPSWNIPRLQRCIRSGCYSVVHLVFTTAPQTFHHNTENRSVSGPCLQSCTPVYARLDTDLIFGFRLWRGCGDVEEGGGKGVRSLPAVKWCHLSLKKRRQPVISSAKPTSKFLYNTEAIIPLFCGIFIARRRGILQNQFFRWTADWYGQKFFLYLRKSKSRDHRPIKRECYSVMSSSNRIPWIIFYFYLNYRYFNRSDFIFGTIRAPYTVDTQGRLTCASCVQACDWSELARDWLGP